MPTINILTPTLRFGTTPIISIQVQILDGATTLASRYYFCAQSDFSAVVDEVAANYASLHFGTHVLDVNNGNYSGWFYNGATRVSPYALALEVAEAVADLA
jgi:hypothetical protein